MTVFAPIATGGVNQQPITSFNYENIGVNIDITPRIHHNEDVSLTLKIEVSNMSGTGYGGLPTFGNRSITTTIRLKDGETNMLAGLIRDEDRRMLDGVPGLSDLPVIGRLFAANHVESIETDIILMVTPHIIRVLDLKAEDLAAFRVGREGGIQCDCGVPVDRPRRASRRTRDAAGSAPWTGVAGPTTEAAGGVKKPGAWKNLGVRSLLLAKWVGRYPFC